MLTLRLAAQHWAQEQEVLAEGQRVRAEVEQQQQRSVFAGVVRRGHEDSAPGL